MVMACAVEAGELVAWWTPVAIGVSFERSPLAAPQRDPFPTAQCEFKLHKRSPIHKLLRHFGPQLKSTNGDPFHAKWCSEYVISAVALFIPGRTRQELLVGGNKSSDFGWQRRHSSKLHLPPPLKPVVPTLHSRLIIGGAIVGNATPRAPPLRTLQRKSGGR